MAKLARILITGFGPFDGGSNASEALLRGVEDRFGARLGQSLATRLLPVDTEAAPAFLRECLADANPTHLLMMGQAAGRNRLALERFAVNLRDFGVPDAAGRVLQGQPVVAGGPPSHVATWPDLEGAVRAMEAAGVPAAVSNHAGTHLCNQLLYCALHDGAAAPRHAVFLHVPVLPAQVIRREPATLRHAVCPFLPLDMALRGVEIMIDIALATPVSEV